MDHPDLIERDQFDRDHKVNTSPPLSRFAYKRIQNLEKGHNYQASWTSEVRQSFDITHRFLKDRFEQFSFVDVGCGKGKVNLIWQQELDRRGLTQRNSGVDYYEPLVTIARNNWKIMFPDRPSDFRVGDAQTYDFRRHGTHLILYMFNPFSTMIMLPFIRNLKGWPTVLIYNVPNCDQIIRTCDFTVIDQRQGGNQNQSTTIYKNF